MASTVAPRRAGGCAVDRHAPAAGTGSNVSSQVPRKARAAAASGISPASSALVDRYHAERLRIRRPKRLHEIIAQSPGVQLTSLFGGVNGAKTSVDLRGFRRVRDLQ
jgi:iron complex outermembrane receptor protein